MKIIATIGAGMLIATGVAAAVPAEAQRYGWNDGGRGWDRDGDRGWRGDRRWDRGPRWDRGWDRRWQGNRGWRGHRGWRGDRGWYGRPRTVCRWVDGYYGPQRRCFRVR